MTRAPSIAVRALSSSVLALLIMACGDDAGKPSERADAGGDGGRDERDASDDASASPRDAAADSGRSSDDAGLDAGQVLDGANGSTTPPSAGEVPSEWSCGSAFWGDAICDCGCGVRDFDCTRASCSELECVEVGCDACYTVSHAYKACEPAPLPDAWACSTMEQLDDVCDCGCGAIDEACRGSGCREPGCSRDACGRRHDAAGNVLTDARPPSNGWRCANETWGAGDGCDCGCGAPDPDCQPGLGCSGAQCNASECQICHDDTGRVVPCNDALVAWTCDPQRFGSGDGCDCGCGVADPDCAEAGCTTYGCRENSCQRCTDAAYGNDALVGCAPAGWTCNLRHYGTGDGCDCGCGIADPDCGAAIGCSDKSCQHASCDYCHGNVGVGAREDDDYVLCDPPGDDPGWTCGSTTDPAWADDSCDCGCGKPDPACRKANRLGCSESACKTEACEYCNASGEARSACSIRWLDGPTCDIRYYGLDGRCDCGCGARDPDCAPDRGCALPFCAAEGCDVCHGSGENLIACATWTCPAEAYADGARCDCGCGAPDPDCSMLGCVEPGCSDPACSPDGCHDPFGRTVACP